MRTYDNAIHAEEMGFLMGVVTDQVCASDFLPNGECPPGKELQVAEVAHANFVLETIAMLPPPVCK
jgi:hypothetical protein